MELPPFPTVGAIPTLVEEVPPPAGIEEVPPPDDVASVTGITEVPPLADNESIEEDNEVTVPAFPLFSNSQTETGSSRGWRG